MPALLARLLLPLKCTSAKILSFVAVRADQVWQNSFAYSVFPNIKSVVAGLRTFNGDSTAGPALYWARLKGQNMATVDGTSSSPTDLHLDASKSSSLYQDTISEVRVNGLFGMFLIRFQ